MGLFEKLLEEATTFQKEFYEYSIQWNGNLFKKDEHLHLRNYIGRMMFGPPPRVLRSNGLYIYTNKDYKNIIKLVFDKIVKYASLENDPKNGSLGFTFDDGDIFCTALCNFIFADKACIEKFTAKEKEEEEANKTRPASNEKKIKDIDFISMKEVGKKLEELEKKLEKEKKKNEDRDLISDLEIRLIRLRMYVTRHTVIFKFKVLKEGKEAAWFMDINGRIYKSWTDYIKNNTLAKCTMLIPKDGIYQFGPDQSCKNKQCLVLVECHQSPECFKSAIVAGINTAVTAGSIGCIGVAAVSLVTTVPPVLAAAAIIAGIIFGFWQIVRCTAKLVDRWKHKESIWSKETLGDWMTIGCCSFGLLTMGASKLLTTAIEKGINIGRTEQVLYNLIQGGSIIMNGARFSHGLRMMFMKTEEISTSDFLRSFSEIFFLYLSIRYMQSAESVIESSQTRILKDYKNSLHCDTHREAFEKLTQNVVDKAEIIRGINKIANKNEFFANIVRNQPKIDTQEFSKISMNERVQLVSSSPAPSYADVTKGVYKFHKSSPNGLSSETLVGQDLSNAGKQTLTAVFGDMVSILLENSVIFFNIMEFTEIVLPHVLQNGTNGDILAAIIEFSWRFIRKNIMDASRKGVDIAELQSLVDFLLPTNLLLADKLIENLKEYLKRCYTRRFSKVQFDEDDLNDEDYENNEKYQNYDEYERSNY